METNNEPAEITMELTPDMERELVDLFNVDIELLNGSRTLLPDGRAELRFSVTDPFKKKMIIEFMMHVSRLTPKNHN